MTEGDRPVYCTQCGSIVYPSDNFCGVCGSAVSPNAPDATPTQNIPTQIHASPDVLARGRRLTPVMVLTIGVALVVLLGVGSVGALTLLRGEEEPPKAAADKEEAAAEATDEAEPKQTEDSGTSKDTKQENDAKQQTKAKEDDSNRGEKKGGPQDDSGPAPGYNLIRTPDGGLTVEVPPSWGVETGKDSEKDAKQNTWSYHAGEYLNSSITTATSIDAWYSPEPASGAYIVASKELAQRYTNDELIYTLLFEGKADKCTPGPYQDYNRPPYSGKIQTWFDCGVNDVTTYTLAAAPMGRKCVVVLDAILVSEADRKAIQHIVNTFEVDCGRVTSEALATPSAPPSSGTDATPSATPSPSPNPNASPDRNYNAPNPNAPDYNAPSPSSPAAGNGGCEPPAYPVPPGDPRDGDNDGCAGET